MYWKYKKWWLVVFSYVIIVNEMPIFPLGIDMIIFLNIHQQQSSSDRLRVDKDPVTKFRAYMQPRQMFVCIWDPY